MFGISQNSLGSGVLKLLHGNICLSQKNIDTKPCSEHLLHFIMLSLSSSCQLLILKKQGSLQHLDAYNLMDGRIKHPPKPVGFGGLVRGEPGDKWTKTAGNLRDGTLHKTSSKDLPPGNKRVATLRHAFSIRI